MISIAKAAIRLQDSAATHVIKLFLSALLFSTAKAALMTLQDSVVTHAIKLFLGYSVWHCQDSFDDTAQLWCYSCYKTFLLAKVIRLQDSAATHVIKLFLLAIVFNTIETALMTTI